MKSFVAGIVVWFIVLAFSQWSLFIMDWHPIARFWLAFMGLMLLANNGNDNTPPTGNRILTFPNIN